MKKMLKSAGIVLLTVSVLMSVRHINIRNNIHPKLVSSASEEPCEAPPSTLQTLNNTKENYEFFGSWRIDEAVLRSDMYTGTSKDGDTYLYDPEDYIGNELEYLADSFRLGDQIYDSPKYMVCYETVNDFQAGGKFRLPSLDDLIEEKKIKVNSSDEYEFLADVPLLYFHVEFTDEVQYNDYPFIPVGTQCYILNNDTMLIGIWGKILMAHKLGTMQQQMTLGID